MAPDDLDNTWLILSILITLTVVGSVAYAAFDIGASFKRRKK